jgi:transcriptional regulator with XRE-family HTH domain
MQKRDIQNLAKAIATLRRSAGLSASRLAERAGVAKGTVTRLELGEIANPQPDTLRALAEALGVPTTDLYVTADWLPKEELPSFTPYLRSKYRGLTAKGRAELEQSFRKIAEKYGYDGSEPAPGEDQH